MKKNLFDFSHYRDYLIEALPTHGEERGSRTKLATQLGVQKGFISSILHGGAELSLEQGMRVSHFLSHTEDERDYFLLLVQMARAGSNDLETHFSKKIQEMITKRKQIRERIQVKDALSEGDQLHYYSNWHYTAIHMCLRIKKRQTIHAISRYLGLPSQRVFEVLDFFVKTGIASHLGDIFEVGPTRLHISADSPHVARHHTNWRMQAIQSLDRRAPEDLHYSLVMSISKDAALKIREALLRSIQSLEPVIRDAHDEEVVALTIDLFGMQT